MFSRGVRAHWCRMMRGDSMFSRGVRAHWCRMRGDSMFSRGARAHWCRMRGDSMFSRGVRAHRHFHPAGLPESRLLTDCPSDLPLIGWVSDWQDIQRLTDCLVGWLSGWQDIQQMYPVNVSLPGRLVDCSWLTAESLLVNQAGWLSDWQSCQWCEQASRPAALLVTLQPRPTPAHPIPPPTHTPTHTNPPPHPMSRPSGARWGVFGLMQRDVLR